MLKKLEWIAFREFVFDIFDEDFPFAVKDEV